MSLLSQQGWQMLWGDITSPSSLRCFSAFPLALFSASKSSLNSSIWFSISRLTFSRSLLFAASSSALKIAFLLQSVRYRETKCHLMHQSASASKKTFSLTETPYLAFKSFSSISFLWMVASRSCIFKTLKVQTHVSILKEISRSRVAAWLIISLFSGFSTYRLLGFCKLVMNIGQLGLQFAADFLQLLTSLTSNKYVLFIINQESKKKANKQIAKMTISCHEM